MATKTIGSSGRDYATLALWAAYVNALTLSAPEIGQCFNDSEFTYSSAVTFGGWTGGSGTNTVTLTCGTGQSFRDNANKLTNALRYNAANGVGVSQSVSYDKAVKITTDFFIIDGIQWKATDANSTGWVIADNGSVGNATLQNCIFQGTLSANSSAYAIDLDHNTSLIQNCVVLLTSTGSVKALNLSQGAAVTDCTVVSSNSSSGSGLRTVYTPNPVVKNAAVAGFTTDYTGTAGAGSTNNATDKGSFGGTGFGTTGGQVSLVPATEWQSVTLGSEDLRVNSSTSVKLKGNGATTGPSTDIVGSTRSAPYTIGAWQVAGTTNTTITPSVGSLAITGQAPVVTKAANQFAQPAVGALALTGQAPVVTQAANQFSQPSVGSLAITGQAPTITLGNNKSFAPATGTLAITGQAPIVTTTLYYVITPLVGALALTGQAPTVTVTTVTTQLGLSVGSPQAVGGIECYESVTHVRAGMGTGGIEAILYTAP